MCSKIFLRVALSALLLTVCTASANAQVIQASGKVTLKQADGTTVPVQGASVVIHRTDIKGEYKVKTDKNGRYVYAGIPFSGTYTIIVSAPNARPSFLADLRLSQKPENDFVLEPGDGSTLTIEQVKSAQGASGSSGGSGGDSAAARRAQEELARRNKEFEEEKKKIEDLNAKLNEVMKLGNEAYTAKKYDEAIASYDQGIQLDPEQAVFYRNKSLALRARGVDKFNAAIKAKDNPGKEAARADFKAAAEAGDKALTLYRTLTSKRATQAGSTGGTAATGAPTQRNDELAYLESRAENYRIAMQTSTPGVAEGAVQAIQDYVNAETDPAKKAKMQAGLGEALFQSGKVDEAIAKYQETLASSPDNFDAMVGLGVALASTAETAPDPAARAAKMSEAREVLQRFVSKAPADHPRKQEVASMVEYLNESIKSSSAKPADTDTKSKTTKRKG